MALFMAYQSRDQETYRRVIPILDQIISAHISVIGLPLIMSVNAEDIYQNPILHQYYMKFPSYRENHEEVRKLIKEARQIKDEVAGVDAMLEYFGLEELLELRDSLIKHPHHLISLLSTIIFQRAIDFIDQTIRVLSLIHSLLKVDDPNLLKHIMTASLARVLNVLHDADFAMSCSMIMGMYTYTEIFRDMAIEDAPRPFLHFGTSRWWTKGNPEDWRIAAEFWQPLDRTVEITFQGPPFPTHVTFEHEGDFAHEELMAPWVDPEIIRTGIWTRFYPWVGPDILLTPGIEVMETLKTPPDITAIPQIETKHDANISPGPRLTTEVETRHTLEISPP